MDGEWMMARKWESFRAGRGLSASILPAVAAQRLRWDVGFFGGRGYVRGRALPLCCIIVADGSQKSFPRESQDPQKGTG